MTDEDSPLQFEILDGEDVVASETIDRDVVKIGKLGSSHLHLDDPSVSRIHAVVERADEGSLDLIDLGSAEGTYVDGEEVDKAEIRPGDELRFGDVRVQLVGGAGAGSEESVESADGGGPGRGATVTTDDGREVEPYTLQGYYDDGGNYIPGWYDDEGEYHLGYGYDDDGAWRVEYGYYDPDGEWVPTDEPVRSASEAETAPRRPSDREVYAETFLGSSGGDTLEVAHLWGDHVLEVSSFDADESVVIGSEAGADFIVGEETVDGTVPLVDVRDGSDWLVVGPQMEGVVRLGDDEYRLHELEDRGFVQSHPDVDEGRAVQIDEQSRAKLEFDHNTFLLRFTELPGGVGAMDVDTSTVPFLAISLILHLLFLFLAMSLPGEAGELQRDRFDEKDRFAEMMLKPEKKKPKKPGWMGKDEPKEKESKAGKEEAEEKDKESAMKGPPDTKNPKLKKKRNKKIAMKAGLNKMFAEDQVASNWGSSNETVGSDAIHALGNLDGDSKGSSKGFGGLGLQGAGRGGGGGMSERGVGIGNVGTTGRGGGADSDYGEGAGDLGEKETKTPEVVPGRMAAEGALSKEIIRKVVRQHRREIKYCYEKELQKNPDLKGQVTVQFKISPSGDVLAALVQESTLNNANVEQCLQGKIRRWVFPNPEGGSIVKVNYPFNFNAQ